MQDARSGMVAALCLLVLLAVSALPCTHARDSSFDYYYLVRCAVPSSLLRAASLWRTQQIVTCMAPLAGSGRLPSATTTLAPTSHPAGVGHVLSSFLPHPCYPLCAADWP
jgi:hypothetical protein